MSEPVLSVVIPTLNERGTILDCLDSIGNRGRVEIVVSDGGSTDGTVETLRADGRASVIVGPAGRGPQLRRGVDAAAADRLLLVHADCRLPEGWLTPVVAALDEPGVSLACFRLLTVPVASHAGPLHRLWLRLLDLRSYGPALPYGDQGYALRRDVYERIGGVPNIPLMEDLMMARACRRAGRIARIPLAVRTSSRRFDQRPLRSRVITATFPTLFRIGVAPERLARWYGEAR